MQGEDLIFHRYEGVLLPGRASYRYFRVGGVGGMLITSTGLSRTKLKGKRVAAWYPDSAQNRASVQGAPAAQVIEVRSPQSGQAIYVY